MEGQCLLSADHATMVPMVLISLDEIHHLEEREKTED